MKKKVITATAMMALAAMAMTGCGQSSAPAETTAAATDAPAEDTTASSDETKETSAGAKDALKGVKLRRNHIDWI